MILLCYKNGSIARETIKEQFGYQEWSAFNEQLENEEENGGPGNGGRLAFYYDKAEILPTVKAGVYRYDETDQEVEEYKDDGSGAMDIRGIIESQFMAMRQHSERFGVTVSKILATGGASQNKGILQVLADVFGCAVYTLQSPDSATKGGALRALHGFRCAEKGNFISLKDAVHSVGGPEYSLLADLNMENTSVYTKLLPTRQKLEDQLPRLQHQFLLQRA